MNEHPKNTDPREQLQRLIDALDEDLPDDEEGRIAVEAMGVDVDAMTARIRAKVAVLEAARARRRTTRLLASATVMAACAAGVGVLAVRSGTSESARMTDTAGAPTSTVELSASHGPVPIEPALPEPDAGAPRVPKKRPDSNSMKPPPPR